VRRRRKHSLRPRRRSCRHAPPAEERLPFRGDLRRRVADVEPFDLDAFHLARNEIIPIALAESERLLRCLHERHVANAVMKHQRAAAEGAQHVDDDDNAARVGGAGQQTVPSHDHREARRRAIRSAARDTNAMLIQTMLASCTLMNATAVPTMNNASVTSPRVVTTTTSA